MTNNDEGDNTGLVLGLLFFWILLILVLVYLYKRLNQESNNQYTIHRLVYTQGGLRDRAVQGVQLVTSFVDRIRPQNRDEESDIGGNGDTDNREDEEEEEDGGDKDGEGACHREAKQDDQDDEDEEEDKDDSSDDYSSVDLKERVMRNNGAGEMNTEEKQKEESSKAEEKVEEAKQQEEVKDEERVGLLVNIKPFSGSAIWSEEKTEESNVTAL